MILSFLKEAGGLVNYYAVLFAFIAICLDVVTGIIKACKNGKTLSSIMRGGYFYKLVMIMSIVAGFFMDVVQHFMDIGFSIPVGEFACAYVILIELTSMCENIEETYPGALPSKIVKMLAIAAEKNGVETTDKDNDDDGSDN